MPTQITWLHVPSEAEASDADTLTKESSACAEKDEYFTLGR